MVVAAGAILWGSAASAPPSVTNFPPWYATENARGDPAAADFEAHVPCAIDAVPEPACQRVKLGLVLYRDAATGEPSTYVMSIVRVGVSDEREVRQGEWQIETGMALDAEATVYRLGGAPDLLTEYWAVGEDLPAYPGWGSVAEGGRRCLWIHPQQGPSPAGLTVTPAPRRTTFRVRRLERRLNTRSRPVLRVQVLNPSVTSSLCAANAARTSPFSWAGTPTASSVRPSSAATSSNSSGEMRSRR